MDIFRRHIEQDKPAARICNVTDEPPENCRAYGLPGQDCWFLTCPSHRSPGTMICSSRIIAVSKTTGEVVYDASSNDEG